jgi:hypothetical protein
MTFNLNPLQYKRGAKADTPVDEDIPDSWEPADQITQADIVRQIHNRNDMPPKILTAFQQRVLNIAAQPSDSFSTQSYFLISGGDPVMLSPGLDPGVSCRVRIFMWGDRVNSQSVLIAPAREMFHPASDGFTQPMTIALSTVLTVCPPYLELNTSAPIWGVNVSTPAARVSEVGVLIEQYVPDQYTWEPWEAGRQG